MSCAGFELKTGSRIAVQFTYSNTASQPKLNVNGTGDKFICGIDGTSVITGIWRDKETIDFVYDGSWWIALGCLYARPRIWPDEAILQHCFHQYDTGGYRISSKACL